jgi:hypothetical protein
VAIRWFFACALGCGPVPGEVTTWTTATRKGNYVIIGAGQVAVMVMVKVAVRGGVGPPTFRFSGLRMRVRQPHPRP